MKEVKNKSNKKIVSIYEICIGILIIVLFLTSMIIQIVSPTSSVGKWMKDNIWDIDKTLLSLEAHVPVLIHCLIYIFLVFAVCKVVRFLLKSKMEKNNRTKTIVTLADGFVKYGGAIALIILVLKALGVNTQALIASVGVLTLVVGLGAQTLIADVIAGMFIIFENEYNVGEIVAIDDFRGTVIEIGIRSTKILDLAGNIKIINNSNISNVVNMSRELSLAVVDCEFPYDVPLQLIENILNDNLSKIKENIPAIKEGPFYKGVSYYGESNVAVKLIAKCNEEDRYQVQRDLLREYRILINSRGIDLSYPQVVINNSKESDYKLTEGDKKKADDFASKQKELSKDLEEQTNS